MNTVARRHLGGHGCPGWPHCYTPAADLRACLDEVTGLLDRGDIQPYGFLVSTMESIRVELAARTPESPTPEQPVPQRTTARVSERKAS